MKVEKIGWLFIHGIGAIHAVGYSKLYQDIFAKAFPGSVFHEVLWKKYVIETQDEIFYRCKPGLSYDLLRYLFFLYGGDAVDYEKNDTLYTAIHQDITNAVCNFKAIGVDKVGIVSHSLGTIIALDHLWDTEDAWLKNTLGVVVTIASPTAIWSAKYTDGGKCVDFNSFPNLKVALNIFSRFDIVGWPMKTINDSYNQQAKLVDYKMCYGSLYNKLLPTCHTQVWDSSWVAGTIAKKYSGLM